MDHRFSTRVYESTTVVPFPYYLADSQPGMIMKLGLTVWDPWLAHWDCQQMMKTRASSSGSCQQSFLVCSVKRLIPLP